MQIIYPTTFLARSACDYCYYYTYQATLVADGEWRCRPEVPWQLQVQLLKMTMVTGLSPMGNGNGDPDELHQLRGR